MYGVVISQRNNPVDCSSIGVAIATGAAVARSLTDAKTTCTSSISTTATPTSTTSIGSTPTSSHVASGIGGAASPASTKDGGREQGSSSSLGKGAIAGIVVGAVLGIALLVLATWWITRYRVANRQTEQPGSKPLQGQQGQTWNVAQMSDVWAPKGPTGQQGQQAGYLQGSPVSSPQVVSTHVQSLTTGMQAPTMYSQQQVHELPSQSPNRPSSRN